MRVFRLRRKQSGDALFEALIGLLLMGAVALGLAYATSRAVNTQRFMNTQNLAITEIRDKLQHQSEPCAVNAIPVTLGGQSFNFSPECNTDDITIRFTLEGTETEATLSSVTTLDSVSTSETESTRQLFGGDGTIVINLR